MPQVARHPRNRTHQMSKHTDILNMAVNEIIFRETIFKENNVKLALNLPYHAHIISQKNKIPTFRFYESKFNNRYTWSEYLHLGPNVTIKDFHNVKEKNLKRVKISKPYQAYIKIRKQEVENLKFINILKFSIKRSLQLIYGKIKNYRKAKNTYTLDDFLFIWRWRNNYINHKRYVSCNPKTLKNKSLFSFH